MSFKMVRDRTGELAQKHGVSGVWRPAANPIASLRRKILEEIGEYVEHLDPGELYDIQDVLNRLISLSDPFGIVAGEHDRKVARLGMFDDLIEWSPVPPENENQVQA